MRKNKNKLNSRSINQNGIKQYYFIVRFEELLIRSQRHAKFVRLLNAKLQSG